MRTTSLPNLYPYSSVHIASARLLRVHPLIPVVRRTLFQAVLILLIFGGCSPFPPASTGVISSMKFENECFDLATGKIEQGDSINEKCGRTLWDFAFVYDGRKLPHAELYLNPLLDVKAVYPAKDYASLTFADALTTTFTAQFQDQPFQLAIIQTPLHHYYKVHVIREMLNTVWFEWEELK